MSTTSERDSGVMHTQRCKRFWNAGEKFETADPLEQIDDLLIVGEVDSRDGDDSHAPPAATAAPPST